MGHGLKKAERLREMERLYCQRGFTDQQLAKELGVTRQTIFRDRIELEAELGITIEKDAEGRYRIHRSQYLSSIRVNLPETVQLYLAARRASQQTRSAQQSAASSLEKLALTLKQPMTQRLVKAASTILERRANPMIDKVFEAVARAWVDQTLLRIRYRGLDGDEAYPDVLAIYLIEPSPWSDSVYLIGHSDKMGKIVSYRLDRIEHVFVSGETYTLPADYDEDELLRYAWGIWRSDKDPETVRLRFATGRAAKRLQESVWHPLEEVTTLENGDLLWEAPIAEPREMLPWIRGWGADVEVIEPNNLKQEIIKHISIQATQYKVAQPDSDIEPYHQLWAKADRKTATIHRLVYHMIDVGLTAKTIWQQSLHPQLKEGVATWLSLNIDEAGSFVAFLASLHDLGKASPAFQDHPRMNYRLRNRILSELRMAGFSFVENRPSADKRARHEVISTWALRPTDGEALLSSILQLPADLAIYLAQALGGHHGAWPRPDLFGATRLKPADKGGDEWAEARRKLVQTMHQIFQPPTIFSFKTDLAKDNVMLTLLSAIVATADWIGSDDEYFPYEDHLIPLAVYTRHAQKHAEAAIARVGWKTPESMPEFDFERVFPFKPNDAQNEISTAIANIDLPAMVIIENQMGAGKTESAFSTCAQWARRSGSSGLYIAMPTTATSNQMHTRTSTFLTRQIGKEIEPLLVHSQALLRDVPEPGDPVEQPEHEGDAAAGQAWFLPRKKSLLAPYGVGTVDQALMGILQTKHFFVRLLGMSYKTVIFDEVHAYDAYMSELFERLLVWLRAVGASVIILSATLPEKARQKLIKAYAGDTSAVAPAADYPRITYVDAKGKVNSLSLTPPPTKTLYIDWVPREEDQVIAKLQDLLANGGCAAVICNTVTRAQNLFQAIRSLPEELCPEEDLILFHARFPMAWREEIEQKVVRKFGPGSEKGKPNLHRPSKAIVVATQVIEQSLDLDFDVMISDHAPIDLLLQRSGRLQRHSANNPRSHPNCLWIAEPIVEDGVPKFDRSDKFVYAEYVLLRSWLVLKNRLDNSFMVPDCLSNLIESVYGDLEPSVTGAVKTALSQAKRDMDNDQFGERVKARKRRTPKPDDETLLWGDNLELDEDDPTVHETFQAMTRSDRPGLSVVCLHRIGEKLFLDPSNLSTAYNPDHLPSRQQIHDLARQTVLIRRPEVEKHLLSDPTDEQIKTILKHWRRAAGLRYHRVVIFENGICRLSGTPYVLRLQKENQLGLQISKETK